MIYILFIKIIKKAGVLTDNSKNNAGKTEEKDDKKLRGNSVLNGFAGRKKERKI